MKVECCGGQNLILHLDCGKVFSVGVRGLDKLVVAQMEGGETISSRLTIYIEGKGESGVGIIRHLVLE